MRLRMLATTLLLIHCAAAQSQQPVKCQDAAGRIVYVDRECEVYGLRQIGTVQDRVTVTPSRTSEEGESSKPGALQAMQACRADAQKFCRDVKPGSGAIMDCLLDHQQEMSEACYQFLKAKLHPGE